jgi:hypothetical protein
MGLFDFLKSYKKRSDAKKKPLSRPRKVKTADKEGYDTGTEVKVPFDEGKNRTVKKPPASIIHIHRGNNYTFLAAYKYNAYALERQYILKNNNVDSVLKKVNTTEGVFYCIYTRKLASKETTTKPKKRASTKKRKYVF